eukprot:3974168-Pleurochrysis_carterae.AAC.2
MYVNKFYAELLRRLLAVLRHNMARSLIKIMVFNLRDNQHHVNLAADQMHRIGPRKISQIPSISCLGIHRNYLNSDIILDIAVETDLYRFATCRAVRYLKLSPRVIV